MCALLAIDACINQNLAALVPGPFLTSQFLYDVLVASYDDIREYGRGGNQAALNCEIVGRILIPVPQIEEQNAICQAIKDRTSHLLPMRQTVEQEIKLLQEYRTRLAADVVTGKLDVRVAARNLPDEAEPADIPGTEAEGIDAVEFEEQSAESEA